MHTFFHRTKKTERSLNIHYGLGDKKCTEKSAVFLKGSKRYDQELKKI